MIELTKLNGQSFILNALYIEQIQALPDTTITLTNGKIYVVRESKMDVLQQAESFLRKVSIIGLSGEKSDHHV